MRGHLVGRTAIALCAVAVAVISLVPIGYLFLTGISLHDVRQQFRYPATAAAVWGVPVTIEPSAPPRRPVS